MRVGIGILMAAMLASCHGAPAPAAQIEADAGSSMPRGHAFDLTSARTGLEYVVLVSEPVDPLPAGAKAPVVYVTDGDWYFGMATDAVRQQKLQGAMGPTYVVAIAYARATPDMVYSRREHELVHKPFKGENGVMGGGGEDFLLFVTEQVRPLVEARFPIDKNRAVLAGQSLGGLFATNVLLSKPESFYGYLIGSPSLWADPSLLAASRNFTGGEGHRVYVGVGGGESPPTRGYARSLAEALSARSTGLAVESAELARYSHMTMQGAWFAAGLRYLVPKAGAY